MDGKTFCSVVNCMDGRTQLPVNAFMRREFGAAYVDTITEPGPVKILAEQSPKPLVESIYNRLRISVGKHGSQTICIVSHHDCAGNPADKETQLHQLHHAVDSTAGLFPKCRVIGVWVDASWEVETIC